MLFFRPPLFLSAILVMGNCAFAIDSKALKMYISDAATSRGGKAENIQFMPRKVVPGSGGWEMAPFVFDFVQNGARKPVSDVVYTYGDYISADIIQAKSQISAKELFLKTPTLDFYTREAIVAGNFNAIHKVVIFSDPLCPICKETMADFIQTANSHPSELAIFVYHYPLLSLHPQSPTIIKSILFFKSKGVDILPIIYSYDFRDVSSERAVLETINTLLKSNGIKHNITPRDLNSKGVIKRYNADLKKAKFLSITFTPSVYTDGEHDHAQKRYKQIKNSL